MSIYSLVQASNFWFMEYIKTMNLKAGFKQCKNDPCLLYRVNEAGTVISILYVEDMLVIRDKPELMDMI